MVATVRLFGDGIEEAELSELLEQNIQDGEPLDETFSSAYDDPQEEMDPMIEQRRRRTIIDVLFMDDLRTKARFARAHLHRLGYTKPMTREEVLDALDEELAKVDDYLVCALTYLEATGLTSDQIKSMSYEEIVTLYDKALQLDADAAA